MALPELDIFQLPPMLLRPPAKEVEREEAPPAQPPAQPPTRRRQVSFSDFSEMYYIPHVDEMTKEEFDATYMSEEEFIAIRQENDATLRVMKRGQYPATRSMYFRGLEPLMPERRVHRKLRIHAVVSTVLDIQEHEGNVNPEVNQNHFTALTTPCVAHAMGMGIYDAQAQLAEQTADIMHYYRGGVPREEQKCEAWI